MRNLADRVERRVGLPEVRLAAAPEDRRFVVKAFAAKALKVAQNPALRPIEVWALRAIIAFAAVKLGIDASKL